MPPRSRIRAAEEEVRQRRGCVERERGMGCVDRASVIASLQPDVRNERVDRSRYRIAAPRGFDLVARLVVTAEDCQQL